MTHQAASPAGLTLNRRAMLLALLAGMFFGCLPSPQRVVAQPATPVAPRALDLARLFPDAQELPAGLELESTGVREGIGQIAGTFRNSRDAAQLLASWGWLGNVYRTYAAEPGASPATPARIEISLHQFRTSTGAAYALSYLAHDRAVALHQQEESGGTLLPCATLVFGEGEATQFLRSGALLVRVTVAMPAPVTGEMAQQTATGLALTVLANTGGFSPDPSVGCRLGDACRIE
ncbi:MAG: hypothetical protein R2853_11970 [Thermomicrobiales bacterium]